VSFTLLARRRRKHAAAMAAAMTVTIVTLAAARLAAAAVERFALVVGNNEGDAGDLRLRFAEEDASRVAGVLTELGGYRPENVTTIRHRDGAELRRALIAINDRIRHVTAATSDRAVLFVYYSGHADVDALHLGTSRLDLTELRQLVSGSAAQFRLLVLDSCRSGALTRLKGARAAPAFDVGGASPAREIRLDDRLAEEGVVFLTSAAADEDAQESDALAGSVFTHYFISGLMGAADTDGDGRVSLSEAYRHAYEATVRASSRTLAGAQHPTFQFRMRGQGDVPLTYPGEVRARRATLTFPRGRTYLVMAGGPDGKVIAEVATGDGARRLNLAPGRYFLRARSEGALFEGPIDVPAERETAVDETRLERIDYARLVRKGGVGAGADAGRVLGVHAGYRLRSALWSGASLCQGAFAGYTLALASLYLRQNLGYCTGGYRSRALTASTDEADLGLAIGRAWDTGRLMISAELEAGAALLIQRFMSANTAPSRMTAAGHFGAGLGVEVALAHGFYVLGGVGVQAYVFNNQEADSARLTTAPVVRGSAGLGKYW